VDRFSASASEILAGALQDYDRALVVGTGPTHGKGTVQVLVDLDKFRDKPGPPLGVLKITTQQYFRVDGESTQSRGVIPDIVLPDPAAYIESGERFLDNAIPWSEVEALTYQKWKKRSWDRKALAEASKKRVAKQPAFSKLQSRAQLLEKRRERTEVPLAYKSWKAQREADEKALDAVSMDLDEGPKRFAVEDVSYGEEKPGSDDERIRKRLERWRDNLARDPWVEEALRVMEDMEAEKTAKK
jgi:carboxyl-terminal processing protease